MPRLALLRSLSTGAGLIALVAAGAPAVSTLVSAQSDLDAFMKEVVARRDDNWKKLQQYVLDEREEIDLRGPGNVRLWGEQRDYTWFIRDGFFIKSPVRFNGVTIGDADRRKHEDIYLRMAQQRDRRQGPGGAGGGVSVSAGSGGASVTVGDSPAAKADQADTPAGESTAEALANVDGLIQQARQPQFVSSAYFLRFKFDEGTYALVGREQFDGRDVLRVEYYPTKLYSNESRSRGRRGGRPASPPAPGSKEDRQATELRRVLNKVALVTIWIEPASHQIVKYTFDNVDFDFLPVPWLVRVDTVKATMTMGQPFPDVWLPRGIEISIGATLANGDFAFRQSVAYHDYREATVTTKVGIPGASGKR